MASRFYGNDGQPGLEVVHYGADGVEVVPQERALYPHLPQVRNRPQDDGKELLVVHKYPGTQLPFEATQHHDQGRPPTPPTAAPTAEAATKPRRRLWIFIGVPVGLVLILAAVLGGTLGSRAARSTSSSASAQAEGPSAPGSTPTAPATPPPSSTQRPQQIKQGSALATTGMRMPDGGLNMFLFYHDAQNTVRFSRCNTTKVAAGEGKNCWDPPTTINAYARADPQLSAGTIIYGDKQYNQQTQLVYSGEKGRFLSTNINDLKTPRFGDDSVNWKDFTTGPNTSLTSYWPWTIYQDSAGRLHHVRNKMLSGYAPNADWDNNALDITPLTGSNLAMVPMSTNFSQIAEKGGYAVFYQTLEGRLAVSITDLNSPQLDPAYSLSWPTVLPSIDLPKQAPIAALSVARPDDARQRVDTYVWYLDASSHINVLYTDTSSGSPVWKTSQPTALRGADPDTSLSCLTMATSHYAADGFPKLLERASADTRCYFQRGGLVMEARLDRGDWIVTGNVPIP